MMNKSLLQSLQYNDEYKKALTLTEEQCNVIIHLAKIKNITFNPLKKPGETILKYLDRMGYSVEDYRCLLKQVMATPIRKYSYRPQAKVAILIGNDAYQHLNLLAAPVVDCKTLSCSLETLGFQVFLLTNLTSTELKDKLVQVISVIPESSYCFVYYAGHGCEIYNVRCMLGIDCPPEDMEPEHLVTENYVLGQLQLCGLELCVFILDMCRTQLDRSCNAALYSQILDLDDGSLCARYDRGVLFIVYTTSSAKTSYEMVQIEHSGDLDTNQTYSLQSDDAVVVAGSVYAKALSQHVLARAQVASVLDATHSEVEKSEKEQRPIKVQCGTAVRSLRDPVADENSPLLQKLKTLNFH